MVGYDNALSTLVQTIILVLDSFPAHTASVKAIICGLTKSSYHLHNMIFDQETHFTAREMWQSYHVPNILNHLA